MLGQRANLDSQDSPWPKLGGSHHLPPYSIPCASPRGPHPSGSPEIAKIRTLTTLGPRNFARKPLSEMKSEAKL
jgi:hypothetical protein